MDAIIQAHEQLEKRSNLSKAIADTQDIIALLQNARDAITNDPNTALLTMAKLKQPVKSSFEKLDDDLKEVNKGLNQYQKALDRKFKKTILPTASTGPLVEQPELINRAIVMHLLRDGKFDVANVLNNELLEQERADNGDAEGTQLTRSWMQESGEDVSMSDCKTTTQERSWIQRHFTEMYTILDALKNQHDLAPAISWARDHSIQLEQRGSNLEFELSRLKFVELYMNDVAGGPLEGRLRALQYAQTVFQGFNLRYMRDSSRLLGSLAFSTCLEDSPYHDAFFNQTAWEEASESFTREFCGLLGLSEKSPLYTAVTAGGIALPVIEKFERIMAESGGQWTSPNELPVETPLPQSFKFHSIFVCPVSKEQATDDNPPMMLPCGHVIAQQSLEAHSRGKNRMKCPYCPQECQPRDARRIFI
ncbi:hypothetical protein AMS68_003550 [Peltaster fructicola]|uniref:GID complex catalytic subunit 2 n=1 Tax=Peltaster fructicola TaxID=286661 RepID=A0A6H0XTI5_9PEZI|nr:hypothetical protein AMS68_003550 [Peltaster fructicola]